MLWGPCSTSWAQQMQNGQEDCERSITSSVHAPLFHLSHDPRSPEAMNAPYVAVARAHSCLHTPCNASRQSTVQSKRGKIRITASSVVGPKQLASTYKRSSAASPDHTVVKIMPGCLHFTQSQHLRPTQGCTSFRRKAQPP